MLERGWLGGLLLASCTGCSRGKKNDAKGTGLQLGEPFQRLLPHLSTPPSRLSQRRFAFPPFSSCEQPDVLQQLLKRLARQSCNCANGSEEESPKSNPHFCNLGGRTTSRTTTKPYLLLHVANPLAILTGVPLQPASCRQVWKPHAFLPLLQCCRRKASITAGKQ